MMIEHSIFARSNATLSDQKFCQQIRFGGLEVLVKIMFDPDDQANKSCPIMCVFARSYDR